MEEQEQRKRTEELVEAIFDIKPAPHVAFTVKIIGCRRPSFWYADRIGESFTVVDESETYLKTVILIKNGAKYIEDPEARWIEKADAEIVSL